MHNPAPTATTTLTLHRQRLALGMLALVLTALLMAGPSLAADDTAAQEEVFPEAFDDGFEEEFDQTEIVIADPLEHFNRAMFMVND